MKRAAIALAALLAAGCSSLPPTPIYANDVCFRCSRAIGDTKLAGEIIDTGGRAFKFKTAACMAKFIVKQNPDAGAIYVTDFQTGRLVKATAVTFVPMMVGEQYRNKELAYMAFSSSRTAREVAAREKTTAVEWEQVLETARTAAD
jgi:copper chaperone NosL